MILIGFGQSEQARLLEALEKAFQESMLLLEREFTASITSTKWQWPTGDSPRDIVDQGRLRDSQELSFVNNGANFTWSTNYAAAVHEGIVFKNGTTLPPRRWTEDGLNNFQVQIVFSKLFEQYSGMRRI
jgi:hypothetical protein